MFANIIKAQLPVLLFSPMFATSMAQYKNASQVGELVLTRIISQFWKLFKRYHKVGVSDTEFW